MSHPATPSSTENNAIENIIEALGVSPMTFERMSLEERRAAAENCLKSVARDIANATSTIEELRYKWRLFFDARLVITKSFGSYLPA